jgi:SAM-dependent methyltransferase
MHAYQGNLCDPNDPSPRAFASPEFSGFDVAAVGLGFHHFDDPALAARRLGERLKTGGVLMIIDFFAHDKPDVSLIPSTKTNPSPLRGRWQGRRLAKTGMKINSPRTLLQTPSRIMVSPRSRSGASLKRLV